MRFTLDLFENPRTFGSSWLSDRSRKIHRILLSNMEVVLKLEFPNNSIISGDGQMKTKNKLAAGMAVLALAFFMASCDNGTTSYVEEIVVETETFSVPQELVARWYTSQSSADSSSGDRVWEFTQDNKATTPDTGEILFDVTVNGNLISVSGVVALSGRMKYRLSGTELTILESTSLAFRDGSYYRKADKKEADLEESDLEESDLDGED